MKKKLIINTTYMQYQNSKGFTLIEVLISSFIVGLLLSAIFFTISFLNINIQSSSKIYDNKEKLLLTLSIIEGDLKTIINRPIRDEYGDYEASLIIDNSNEKKISLSRILHNDVSKKNETIRIDYIFTNKRLKRNIWNVLDRVQNSKFKTHFLDENIESILIFVIDDRNMWQKFWPISSNESTNTVDSAGDYEEDFRKRLKDYQKIMSGDIVLKLPSAFKIIINHKKYGTIERVILSQI